jgi:hypothetical protein
LEKALPEVIDKNERNLMAYDKAPLESKRKPFSQGELGGSASLTAFDAHDGPLNDCDLIRAAQTSREQYLEVMDSLLNETSELAEIEAAPEDDELVLYIRIRPRHFVTQSDSN